MTATRIAILASGRGSNAQALLDAARGPDAPFSPAVVITNRPGAGVVDRAVAEGVPHAVIDHAAFEDREAFERAVDAALVEANVELVCLAGFMRVLTPWFVTRWMGRLINIHPSLLPLFPGLNTHARALEAGVAVHGCTVHFVTPGVDEGPIIGQAAVAVRSGDDPESLAARVLTHEHALYPDCVAAVARGEIGLSEGRRTGPSLAMGLAPEG